MSDTSLCSMLSQIDSFSYEQYVILLIHLTEGFKRRKNEPIVKQISSID